MFQPVAVPGIELFCQSVCQMNVLGIYICSYGKRHLLRSGYRAIRFPHQNMGTEPSAVRQEITRPHLGKEVVFRSGADGADSIESTMEGP